MLGSVSGHSVCVFSSWIASWVFRSLFFAQQGWPLDDRGKNLFDLKAVTDILHQLTDELCPIVVKHLGDP